MVSTGGSPNLKNLGKLKGATEHRPGTYIYNDRMQVAAGVAEWDDCALNIYSTVVSRAGPDRGILDAGSKTLTSDTGGGLDASMVSTGGSPNLKNLGKLKGATEHRPGTYIYNDRMQVAAGVAEWDDCALNIYSTVVSRAGPDRGILDAGSKTLTSDPGGGLDGYGLILEHPEAKIARFAEEHGFLDLARSNTRPVVGDVVRIVPNHVCVVVNMMDEVVMVRGDEIIGTLPVAARGKLR